ncbi:facilitated trehalose transporter Tret1 isoform X1 [Leptinotarsa decemlineata]|uniref:facilitated trehalose transporter Tret1 isoform X1 n=2 Tax=Leptinotarsa decemlineata TaxID=7539 RepID=UPI003D303EBC
MTTRNYASGRRIFQYLASVTGALATMSSGINSSWTSPFITYLTSNSSTIPMTTSEAGWCAVSPALGCLLGPPIAAYLADRIGRKNTVLIMAPVVFFSQLGIGLVRNVWHLALLRLFIGAADGACFTTLPMYVGEISSPDIRGFLSSLICLSFTLGVLLINTIGCFFSIFTCSIICAAVPAVHFLGFIFMPESPYYYIKVGKYNEAKKSLKIFTGLADVDEELKSLSDAVRVQEEIVKNSKFMDLFTIPRIRKATVIFVIIGLALRASAKAPLLSYTKMIFEESGSDISSSLSTIVYCSVEFFVMTITTYFVIDRFGKKIMCVISLSGCGITLFLLGFYFFVKDFHHDISRYLNWLPITTLTAYSVLFNMGLSFTQVCYLSELFPTNVKAKALSFAEISTVLTNAVTVKLFQVMNDGFGTLSGSFFCFSILCMIMLVFVIKYVPETKGMTLEEVQLFFTGEKYKENDENIEGTLLRNNDIE